MRITPIGSVVPDLDQYVAVRTDGGGCEGCSFRKVQFKCSAIPCHSQMHRPYPVIYQPRPGLTVEEKGVPADASA